MSKFWESLDGLRAIADTVRAEDIEKTPQDVLARYELYAEAYFELESVKQMRQKLIDLIKHGRAVTGYLSADFGYGKTTTAIYLWKQCLDNGIVTVPPFLFRQLKDVMQATKAWLAYELSRSKPDLVRSLEAVYQKHAQRSFEEISKEIATNKGIASDKARAIVNEYIALHRDLTTVDTLLRFVEEAVDLAREAGYKGLVIFLDESQEFLRTEEMGAREAIQTLSELIKGIRAMASRPLGLILTMPVNPTETAIEEQAGDIMHRMRELGVFVRLGEAYGRDFPARLWKHLSHALTDEEAQNAIEERTLEALGQLCERKDLSNGPRTVINAFKRVAYRYQNHRQPYTPLHLIEDYLQGHIVFEGRDAKITTTLHRLLELPAVKKDRAYQDAVKLLAAFPRGVDEKKAGPLYAAIQNLADKELWLGEYITQLAEGYALVGIQERAESRPLVDEILRKFRNYWHYAWKDSEKSEMALDTFFEDLLPEIFPKRTQGQHANFKYQYTEKKNPGSCYAILEGSFDRLTSSFPNRNLLVSIFLNSSHKPTDEKVIKENAIFPISPQELEETDLEFRIFFEKPEDSSQPNRILTANQSKVVDLFFNLRRSFGRSFPGDINFLKDIMSPELTSVEVLLALSGYMRQWIETTPDISEKDRTMIESYRRQMHRHVLRLILPDASDPGSMEVQGLTVSGAEQKLVEAIFEAKCAELYPEYKTLMRSKTWTEPLRRYREALRKRPLAERRGRHPFTGTKEEIAKAFGYAHTVFEATARNLQEMGLLELDNWQGRGAESKAQISFKEHPLEKLILKALEEQGQTWTAHTKIGPKEVKRVPLHQLKTLTRQKGYLSQEVEEAIELLKERRYITQEGEIVQQSADLPDAQELSAQLKELRERLNKLEDHCHLDVKDLSQLAHEADIRLKTSPDDEVAMDAAQRKIEVVKHRLEEIVKQQTRYTIERIDNMVNELKRYQAELSRANLKEPVNGSVRFVTQIDDLRKRFEQESRILTNQCQSLHDQLTETRKKLQEKSDLDSLNSACKSLREYQKKKDELSNQIENRWQNLHKAIQKWREIVSKATRLRNEPDLDPSLYKKLNEDITDRILDYMGTRGLDGLLEWEIFEAEINTIEDDLKAKQSQARHNFQALKEKYEKIISPIVPQRMINALYDPQDSEKSYRVLHDAVYEKISIWLTQSKDNLKSQIDEMDYLLQERGISLQDELERAQELSKSLQKANQELNRELIENIQHFERYCNELYEIDQKIKILRENLTKNKAQKLELTEEEEDFLKAVSTIKSPKVTLSEVRRQASTKAATPDTLFEWLKSLYRKGHIEIYIQKRD